MADSELDVDMSRRLGEAGLDEASHLGASQAEVRVERIRSQMLVLRDGQLQTTADDTELAVGLRVLHDGALGFAATVATDPGAARALARQAVETARASALAGGR